MLVSILKCLEKIQNTVCDTNICDQNDVTKMQQSGHKNHVDLSLSCAQCSFIKLHTACAVSSMLLFFLSQFQQERIHALTHYTSVDCLLIFDFLYVLSCHQWICYYLFYCDLNMSDVQTHISSTLNQWQRTRVARKSQYCKLTFFCHCTGINKQTCITLCCCEKKWTF